MQVRGHEIVVDKSETAYLIRICSGITPVNSKLGVTNNCPEMLCCETVWCFKLRVNRSRLWVVHNGPTKA